MEEPISFWGYKEQESNLILPEHDDVEVVSVPGVVFTVSAGWKHIVPSSSSSSLSYTWITFFTLCGTYEALLFQNI